MIVTPEFPEHRLQDPRRQAEWRVYQEITGSQAPGRALYEMRAGLYVPQLDFGIWLQGVAHYGLQVKGGENATEGGEWRLHSANGPETFPLHRPDLRCGDRPSGTSSRPSCTGRSSYSRSSASPTWPRTRSSRPGLPRPTSLSSGAAMT